MQISVFARLSIGVAALAIAAPALAQTATPAPAAPARAATAKTGPRYGTFGIDLSSAVRSMPNISDMRMR